jgi:hypothetical protein
MQQDVIERIATHQSRLDKDLQVVDNFVLTGKTTQLLGSYAVLKLAVALVCSYISLDSHI